MTPLKVDQSNRTIYLVVFFVALIYASISLVNHFLFRTYALDLGLYTNAIYDYSHFSFNDSTVFKALPQNLLADHFDLFLILISPLSLIFGTTTLLFVQIVFILIGGIGVLNFIRLKGADEKWARAGMIYFYLHFSVFSALSFDYHSNVIAASLVPWLFIMMEKKEVRRSFFILTLIIITKENMALWMIFVCLGYYLLNRKLIGYRFILGMTLFSFIYFAIVTVFIMPSLSLDHHFVQFKYSVLGNDYQSALTTIFSHPMKVFEAMFVNTNSSKTGDYVKSESWIFFIFSGGALLFFRPIYLLMLIPVFMQKLLNDQMQTWGINDQYSIELAPILAMGIFSSGVNSLSPPIRRVVFPLAIVGSLICTVRAMDRTSTQMRRANIRVYQAEHWKAEQNIRAIKSAMKLIPIDAIVSSQNTILPHLAYRDKIYSLPMINDAQYIIYEKGFASYPISKEKLTILADSLENTPGWKVLFSKEAVTLLKRK